MRRPAGELGRSEYAMAPRYTRRLTCPPGAARIRPRSGPETERPTRTPEEEPEQVRALLSVANREGISAFARELLRLEVEVFATDGTREHLAADGIEVASVSDLTGAAARRRPGPTFHPAIYAGILARRDVPEQLSQLAEHGIGCSTSSSSTSSRSRPRSVAATSASTRRSR